MSNLLTQYNEEIRPALQKELKIKSVMAVPRISKITLNIGCGKWLAGSKDTAELEKNLTAIAGQKVVVAKAKKSISNFKIREGLPVGVVVTLRGPRAYYFLEKFINIVSPRIRDFRGFSAKSFDGNGNYSLGLRDVQAFPEINPDDVSRTFGLQITIATNTDSDDRARLLLEKMNFPFKKPNK